MKRSVWVLIAAGGVATGLGLWYGHRPGGCASARDRYGLAMQTCPSGRVRQTVELVARNLRRGAEGEVGLTATARYTTHSSDEVLDQLVPNFQSIELSLVDAKQQATPLPVKFTADPNHESASKVTLPEVPDGDYLLRATYTTRIEQGTVELPLGLYTPARIHVLTDRPLYEPGNTVMFRAVVLRARDLAPLDGRPGVWEVADPNGDVMLREAAPAGAWGVVAGTFPLDKGAQDGVWHVRWTSGGAVDDVAFEVKPFTLPRFHVEAAAETTFYRPGDVPKLRGAVAYSSGAPVGAAHVELQWTVSGGWPPSSEWLATALPTTVVTTAAGRFEVTLPKVPADLVGRVTVDARISAVDSAGDRVEGSASLLLSQEGIQVSAVTELANGLVQGFNNRLFVRVTTPDGRVIANTPVLVKRAWDPNDPGVSALLDEDGVASLQMDPGAPVTVVIPALPWRPAPTPRTVTRGEPEEIVGGGSGSLADQVAMDRWLVPLATCAKYYGSAGEEDSSPGAVRIGARVSSSGSIVAVSSSGDALARCTAAVVRGQHLPAGAERMYALSFAYTDPGLPTVTAAVETVSEEPEGFSAALQSAANGARDCVPTTPASEGELTRQVVWTAKAGSKVVTLGEWITEPNGIASGAIACVISHIPRQLTLAEAAASDAMGVASFSVTLPEDPAHARPLPQTQLGYELAVSVADAAAGTSSASAKLRITPGVVPDVRMRVTPILARAGEPVKAELLRGPAFTGKLPAELELTCLKSTAKAKLDATTHAATFTLDKAVVGWCEVTGLGARALVYVQPETTLAVSVKPEHERYAPGDEAQLAVHTVIGGQGAPAAVGLFGVDESLGQLVTLPGADSMARLQPKVTTSEPAFGALDGQALALGRIRGANAAAATVLRVTAIPTAPELDAELTARASTHFDPVEELTANFYRVLAELHVQTRQWEAQAQATDKLQPATMARLWTASLDAVKGRGQPITDAYGRRLELRLLPEDLLELTDPRYVVVVATHLSEDVENWTQWVREEKH